MIDLRESVVVLGGGMTGAFAAKELLDANFKVVMIDAGYCEGDKIVDHNKKIISPSYINLIFNQMNTFIKILPQAKC